MRIADLAPISVQPTSPTDNNQSTRDTVGEMRQYAIAATQHGPVVEATRQALASLPASAPDWRKAQAIFEWVCRRIRFKTDESTLEEMGRSPDQELLIAPYLLLQWRAGDCDDFTMLSCAMLGCAGIRSAICTIKADPQQPWRYSHVYAVAYLEDGSRMAVDTAAAAQGRGGRCGWEAPRAYQRTEWPVS